jgi:hypothetical protein
MEVKLNTKLNEEGLYATTSYKRNKIVFTLSGEEFDKPTRETIHVGNNKHVYDKRGIYMNHNSNPTTFIDGYDVVALVDIESGMELTFDYNESEINMACPFVADGIMVKGKSL